MKPEFIPRHDLPERQGSIAWGGMESLAPAPAVQRFHVFFRARPWTTDLLLAVVVAAIGAVSRPTVSFATTAQSVYSVVVFGCAAALVFRRIRPRFALTLIAALLLMHLAVVQEPSLFAAVVCVIVAYTTQTQLHPPWRWVFAVAVYGGAIAAVMMLPIPPLDADWRGRLLAASAALALLTVAILAGVVRRHRQSRYDYAVERAAALEAQQHTERQLAAVEERARIAREMHDVLGHSLNAIAVQAEGVRYSVRADPGRADQVLADIGRLSRGAVDDVRDLIDVLSTEGTEVTVRPTPCLGDVPALIEDLRFTPSAIRLRVDGDLSSVPGHVGLAAYRIIQESLTNAIRHAGGAPTTVRIMIRDHAVDLTIFNIAAPASPHDKSTSGGHGIVGMQERARAIGGAVDAGPDPNTGGWRVAARLPWSRP